MKALKIFALVTGLTVAVACNRKSDPMITGTYILNFKNEYSIANDTINITEYNISAATYKVERRDGFHRIRDGKIQPKEFRQEHWVATYDQHKRALLETEYGHQVYFNDDGHSLNYNGVYKKLK